MIKFLQENMQLVPVTGILKGGRARVPEHYWQARWLQQQQPGDADAEDEVHDGRERGVFQAVGDRTDGAWVAEGVGIILQSEGRRDD